MKQPMMSGHCNTPSVTDGVSSHERCAMNGAGNRANPEKAFIPCPCPCHFEGEVYECGNCERPLAEAPHWPNEDPDDVDEDGNPEMVYTHLDQSGRAIGEECP